MAHFKYIPIIIVIAISTLYGCEKSTPEEQKMVIEGWIEAGKEPVVMLHYAYSLEGNSLSDDATLNDIISNQLERMARVAISDGEKEYVLTGQMNSKYMPPYIYTTTHMVGEAGRNYTITASRHQISATATTFIPQEKPIVDSIRVSSNSRHQQVVLAHIKTPETKTMYYNAFLRRKGEYQLISYPMSMVSSAQSKNGTIELPIYCSRPFMDWSVDFSFDPHDTTQYYLHLAVIDEVSFHILEGISAQSVNQGMFFMSIYKNMPSNVSSGIGYWCGYNANEYPFKVDKDTTFVYDESLFSLEK